MAVLEMRSGVIRSSLVLFSKRLLQLSTESANLSLPSDDYELRVPTVDVGALLSFIVNEEHSYTLALRDGYEYDLYAAIDWFLLETLDGMTPGSSFFNGLRSYTIDLAFAVIEEITKQRLPNHEPFRYHYEGCGHGGSLRISPSIDSAGFDTGVRADPPDLGSVGIAFRPDPIPQRDADFQQQPIYISTGDS